MEEILINRLSKFVQEIRNLTDQGHCLCKISIDQHNLEKAQIIKTKLTAILSRFTCELYNYFKICNNPDPDEISDFTTYQLQGEEVLAELDAKLKIQADQPSTSTEVNKSSSYSKLPDLKLPEFSGNLLEWHSFWDQFTSNIRRRNLNDVDKLLYLKSSLKGDAARLVDGFDTTNRSYKLAVDTLKARYGKDSEIIYAHHKALTMIKRAGNIQESRQTLDEVSRHLRILQSMKENTNTNQIQYLIMEKFPTDIIYEIKMRLDAEATNSIEEILKQLSIVISAKEEANRVTQVNTSNETSPYTVETLHVNEANNPRTNYNSNGTNHYKRQWNTANPRSSSWNSRPNNKPTKRKFDSNGERNNKFHGGKKEKWSCVFCDGDHKGECNKVTAIDERKAKLKARNRCFSCFKTGHLVRDCNKKKNCQYCGRFGFHNKALCPKRLQNKVKENTSVLHIRDGSTVLQTAVAAVQGRDILKTCRILLDCGSQRSYVTRGIAEELNLQVVEENNLAIFTFGSQKPHELESPLVKLAIVTRDKSIKTFYANVVPSISHGVSQPDKELLDSSTQEKYPLADDGSLSDRIDILLGNDYYFTIISTKKMCIKEGLYLVDSEFGWILSGKIPNKLSEQLSVLTYFQSSCEVKLDPPDLPLESGNIKLLWDLESIGITDSPKSTLEEEAVHHFNKTTQFEDGRYQVKWPWMHYPPELPSNYGLAIGRLKSLLKRSDTETP
ncbi:uncharacterized protein LOC126369938 [Pectinophora gossypiella]|uniref:uncharacterized protein LOC126369938 n=1 Tax=Pectinophora gossypiella TaxID=13191 RepID=UPI00214E937F|nr:uncharacterized protein LOC126369938 [Pectinophora gossypiella]XP_049870497.1 uncharacterized protein LOC126369938 [Pectinophora gossypiella]